MAKTEETRYVCDVCGKEEKWKESIIDHMKGHVSIRIISSEFKEYEKPTKATAEMLRKKTYSKAKSQENNKT